MYDLASRVAALRRPRLLVQAARLGLESYDRERSLPRLLNGRSPAGSGAAILRLLELEADLNAARRATDPVRGIRWTACRHVEVLTALMGEVALLSAPPRGEVSDLA